MICLCLYECCATLGLLTNNSSQNVWKKLSQYLIKASVKYSLVTGGFGRNRRRYPNRLEACSMGFMFAMHVSQFILRIL